VSKSCTDLITQTYAKTYNVPVAISRCGNIFGPGDMNFNRIVPGALKAAIQGETLAIRSNGEFVRDYVYVKDVVAGYILLAEKMDTIRGEAFNFSTGGNYSVIKLVEAIGAVLGKKIPYTIVNNQKNEIVEQSLNYAKAVDKLGWKSATSFEQAMQETYDWYKKYFV
jgi:CDP-glucose 4,6-dehydratase